MNTDWKVYAGMSHSPLHTETPSNSCQFIVKADNPFTALGAANASARRIGIDLHDYNYIEITKVNTND